jgi:hypothetical protein
VAIQFYGTAVEHIVAENEESNAGGFHAVAHIYAGGVSPQLNVQLLHNEIREAQNYHFGPNGTNVLAPSSIYVLSLQPSAVIGMVIRNNELQGESTIQIHCQSPAGVVGMLIERNRTFSQHNIQVDQSISGEVLVRQ